MAIYFQYKFHDISSICYLVMADDGKTDRRTDQLTEGRMDSAKLKPLSQGIIMGQQN